ncbi:MAG: hypothetical protein ACFCBU_09700 [Cyanophyceae cyanobacterium]
MDSHSTGLISSCRHCRHYTPEGRRGGHCGQLDALVRGDWKACPFAVSAFPTHWNVAESEPTPLERSADSVSANPIPTIAAQGSARKGKNLKQDSFKRRKFEHHKNLAIAPPSKSQSLTTQA